MGNNKYKATLILVIFSIGFFVTYPFNNIFVFKLISSICAASMIGGFADWFAVTAIFRKPLGIYWPIKIFRTEIIPKNRESIIRALVEIVENELLSKASIAGRVKSIDLKVLLLSYVNDENIKKEVEEFLSNTANEFYLSIDKEDIRAFIGNLAVSIVDSIKIEDMVNDFIKYLYTNGYDDILIDTSIDLITDYVKNPKMHLFFTNFIEKIISEYENDSTSRAMAIKMFMNFVLKKSTSDLALMAEKGINDKLYEIKSTENENRKKLKEYVVQLSEAIKHNEEFSLGLKDLLASNRQRIYGLGDVTADEFEKIRNEKRTLEDLFGIDWASKMTENAKSVLLRKFDDMEFETSIKEYAVKFINSKHSTIGVIVRDNINKYSTEELVALIEGVAGNDLQMIRINGSVVGGLVGMMTFLLTYWVR